MNLLVRMDDITADMDIDKFFKIKELLDKNKAKPLIGVVPDNKDNNLHYCDNNPDFWNLINELVSENWVVSQHGYRHVCSSDKSGLFGINPFSEFAGIPYNKQLEAISSGQRLILDHGISPEIFMALGHSFDRNTLKALKELGFKAITDGLYKKPYIWLYEKAAILKRRLRNYVLLTVSMMPCIFQKSGYYNYHNYPQWKS